MAVAAAQGPAPRTARCGGGWQTLQVSQALAAAQDSQHRHQKQVTGRNPHPTPHPVIRNWLEVADQIEIGCSRGAFGHREASIPPTSTHARSLGKKDCDGL